jgi:hypothetical protein
MSFEACKKSCLSKFFKIISMIFLPQLTFIKILIRFEKVIDDAYQFLGYMRHSDVIVLSLAYFESNVGSEMGRIIGK